MNEHTGMDRPPLFMQGLAAMLLMLTLAAQTVQAGDDPHYSEAGFFDIHVCNWPDRALFLMPLFSTERFSDIDRIEVIGPNDTLITEMDLERYRIPSEKGRPEKRVFIRQVDMPGTATEGWYSASILLKDGSRYRARDYVRLSRLSQASAQSPADGAMLDKAPVSLAWGPVSGAGYYQVFIRDLWNDGRLIFTSGLLDAPRLALPDGLLEAGGYYSWVIHARDSNETALLGDFNHGSLNRPASFSIK